LWRGCGFIVAVSYDFSWEALPPSVLAAIASKFKLDTDDSAESLLERVGAMPTPEVVRDCAAELVDRWLLEVPTALEAVKSACGYEGLAARDPSGFAAQLASSRRACESAAYWLFLRGLRPVGDVYAGLERPWETVAAPESVNFSVDRLQEELRTRLMVDDEWVVIDGSEWTWWPTAAPIRISVGPPQVVCGDITYRVTARCPLVEGVALDDLDRMERLDLWNRDASFFALVHDEDSATIDAVCAFSAHSGNEAIWKLFSAALVLMANFGMAVGPLADEFAGRPVQVPHPISGLRSDADELAANIIRDIVLPKEDRGRFAGDASSIDFQQWPGCALQVPDDQPRIGQAELAFYHDVPAIQVKQLEWPLGTSLVQVDGDADHPLLGNGMMATLSVPDLESFPPHLVAFATEMLNATEALEATGFAFMGAWWAERREGDEGCYDLKFSQFIPSCFYDHGVAEWVAWNLTLRNWWLAEWCGDVAQAEPEE